jgi:hypothetical protein
MCARPSMGVAAVVVLAVCVQAYNEVGLTIF